MIKVLVANENAAQNLYCCRYLSNDKRFEVVGANNGINTLSKYLDIRPNILILDSHFSDMNCFEIIDRLSTSVDEKKNCNIIMTTNNKDEQLSIVDTAKIYKIISKPFKYELLINTINQMCNENKYEELNETDLEILLLRLNFHLASDGVDYLIEAIKQCYYFPALLKSLDTIFDIIGYKFNVSHDAVRSCIRTALKPMNSYTRCGTLSNPIFKLFDETRNVTPKYFLEVVISYLHSKNSRNRKKKEC